MQNYIDTSADQIKALLNLKIDGPFQMLNLLKFKDRVEEENRSGEEQYTAYMKVAMPFLEKVKGKVVYYGSAKLAMIGPNEEWDKIIIVEYTSKEAFIGMATAENYPSAMRALALEDSRLILCEKI